MDKSWKGKVKEFLGNIGYWFKMLSNPLKALVLSMVFFIPIITSLILPMFKANDLMRDLVVYNITMENRNEVIDKYLEYKIDNDDDFGEYEFNLLRKMGLAYENQSNYVFKTFNRIAKLNTVSYAFSFGGELAVKKEIKSYKLKVNGDFTNSVKMKLGETVDIEVLKDSEPLQIYLDDGINFDNLYTFVITDNPEIAMIDDNVIIGKSKGTTYLNIVDGVFWIQVKVIVN